MASVTFTHPLVEGGLIERKEKPMDEQLEFEVEETVDNTEEMADTTNEPSGINPKMFGVGAAILGIAGGVAYKKRDKIKEWYKVRKANKDAKRVSALRRKADEIEGKYSDSKSE